MSTRPESFMPLWIADYLADTMHLTARQHGEYLLLLMYSWKQDRPLPKVDASLRAIARASEEEWKEDKSTILAFFEEGQDGYRQKRLEEERTSANRKYSSRVEASRIANAVKSGKTLPQALPQVMPDGDRDGERHAYTTHNSHISKDIKDMSGSSTPDGYSPDFEKFWKAYPKSQNMSKAAAFKSWRQQKSHLPPLQSLLLALAKYREFLDAETRKQGRAYPAKHAQGWITERRWEGYLSAIESEKTGGQFTADWADHIPQWSEFKTKLSPAEWQVWFSGAGPNGSIDTLVVKSEFSAEKIREKYLPRLQAHFGEGFNIKVTK